MFPSVIVSQHRGARRTRHWSQAVTEQMNAGSESGKLFAAAIEMTRFEHEVRTACGSGRLNNTGRQASGPGAQTIADVDQRPLPQAVLTSCPQLTQHLLKRNRVVPQSLQNLFRFFANRRINRFCTDDPPIGEEAEKVLQ